MLPVGAPSLWCVMQKLLKRSGTKIEVSVLKIREADMVMVMVMVMIA